MTQRHRNEKNKHNSSPSRRHRRVAWAGVVVCGALLATAILMLIEGVREWRIGSESMGWPATEGVITQDKLLKTYRREGQWGIWFAVYERDVSVRYTINRINYISNFRLPNETSSAIPSHPSPAVIASAPNSEHISLFYNPANPSEATIHRGVQLPAIYGVAFGGTASLVLSLFLLVLASWLSRPGVKLRVKSGGAGENRTHA